MITVFEPLEGEAENMGESKQMLFAKNLICICVDEKANADYQGRIYNQYADEPVSFNGTADMFIKVEELFDEWDFPQRGLAERQFKKTPPKDIFMPTDDDRLIIDIISQKNGTRNVQNKKGKLGTFVIHVIFRQAATWQGEVVYQENNDRQDFCSALELIKIIDRSISN